MVFVVMVFGVSQFPFSSVIEVGLMSDDRFVVGHSAATAPGGGLLGQQVIALHQGIVGYGGGSAPTTS